MPATDGIGFYYGGWEAQTATACDCQPGFIGSDCSLRTCPRGSDPETSAQQLKAIRITTGHPLRSTAAAIQAADAQSLDPVYRVRFGGESAEFPVLASAKQVQDAFMSMGSIRAAAAIREATYDANDFSDGKTWTVRLAFASTADDGFAMHSGNPSLDLFQCDTSAAHNGLRAEVLNPTGFTFGTYTIVIDNAAGSTFTYTTPSGATASGVSISADGNMIPTSSDDLRVTFAAASGYTNGESWTVYAPGGALVAVKPATRCDVQSVDFSLTPTGAFTGASTTSYIVKVADDSSTPNTFTWTTTDKGSSESAAASMATAQVALSRGVAVSFASTVGFTAGAEWHVLATASAASAKSTPDRTLASFGSTTTTAATYVVTITSGAAATSTFQVDGGAATAMTANGQSIGNGILLYWSHTSGFFPGQEWTLVVAAGGAVKVIPRPSAPMEAEEAAISQVHEYTVAIDSETGGTAGVSTFQVTRDGVVILTARDIQPYKDGNKELEQITMRFFSTTGYAVGQAWVIVTTLAGGFTVTPSLGSDYRLSSRLETAFSGLTPAVTSTQRFFVRITHAKQANSAGTFAEFEYSIGGAALVTGQPVFSPADTTNLNTELGSGIRLIFAGQTAYGPGQTWVVELLPPKLQLSRGGTVREHKTCSGRGNCDFVTGRCSCFAGYANPACSAKSAATAAVNNEPALFVTSTSETYTGNVMELSTTKAASPDFYFLRAAAAGAPMFGIRGDGQLEIARLRTGETSVTAGLTVESGGLRVADTGVSIVSGGVRVGEGGIQAKSKLNNVNLDVETEVTNNGAQGYTSTLVQLSVTQGPSEIQTMLNTDHYIMKVFDKTVKSTGEVATNTLLFSMLGNGYTSFRKGGVHIEEAGLTLNGGGLAVGSNSETAPTASIVANLNTYTGTVVTLGTQRSPSSAFKFLGITASTSRILDIRGDGLTELHRGGLNVKAGGVTIDTVGLVVSAGGVSVAAGGLAVSAGGATVADGGLVVSDDGFVVKETTSASRSVIVAEAGHATYSGDHTVLSVGRAASSSFKFLVGKANPGSGEQTWLSVDGKGNAVLGHPGSGVFTSIHHDGKIAVSGSPLDVSTTVGNYIRLQAGDQSAGPGGAISIMAGSATSSHEGGAILLRGGDGSQGSGFGVGGSVSLVSGSSRGAGGGILLSTQGATSTGNVVIRSGVAGLSLAKAGDVSVLAGASTLGPPGNIIIAAGDEAAAVVSGGHVSISAGQSNDDTGGSVVLIGGEGINSAMGGSISLRGGESTGATGGSLVLSAGGGTIGDGQVSILAPSGSGRTGRVHVQGNSVDVRSGDALAPGSLVFSAGTTTAAAGTAGSVSLAAGAASQSSTGGFVWLHGGNAVSGRAGSLSATAGSASSAGAAGDVLLSAGSAVSATGGVTSVLAGSSSSAAGGQLLLSAGSSSTSAGGAVTIVSGASSGGGRSGNVVIRSAPSPSGETGSVSLAAGGAASNTNAGSITLSAGATSGTGLAGSVSLSGGAAGSSTGGDVVLAPGSSVSGAAGAIRLGSPSSPFRAVFAGVFASSGKWANTAALAAGEVRTQAVPAADLGIAGYAPALGDVVIVQPQFAHNGAAVDDSFTVRAYVRVAGSVDIVVTNSEGATATLTSFATGSYGFLVMRV